MAELDAAKYFEGLFGEQVRVQDWDASSTLPAYIALRYQWSMLELIGVRVLLMQPIETVPGAVTLGKHRLAAQAGFGGPTALCLDAVSANTRARLLASRIPFVVPGQQLFFPELGIALRERYPRHLVLRNSLPPAAQRLVVLLLLDRIPRNASVAEVARMTGYSAMSASRMLDAVEGSGLLSTEKSGRIRRLKPYAARRKFWERARPFLKSPVERRLPLAWTELPPSVLAAGQLALSRMSDLAEPNIPEYAADIGMVEMFQATGAFLEKDWSDSAAAMLQVWSYPPIEGPIKGVADPFSTFLEFSADNDERIISALDQMLEAELLRV